MVSVCVTLFAVGYSPNKPTVSSVPNSFRKRIIGRSYLWLILHRQKRYTHPYSIAISPQIYGNAVSKEEFYKEIAGIIIEEARMEYEFKEGDEYERTGEKPIKEEKGINRKL